MNTSRCILIALGIAGISLVVYFLLKKKKPRKAHFYNSEVVYNLNPKRNGDMDDYYKKYNKSANWFREKTTEKVFQIEEDEFEVFLKSKGRKHHLIVMSGSNSSTAEKNFKEASKDCTSRYSIIIYFLVKSSKTTPQPPKITLYVCGKPDRELETDPTVENIRGMYRNRCFPGCKL